MRQFLNTFSKADTGFKLTSESGSDKTADGNKDMLSSLSVSSQNNLILKGVF